MLGKLSDLLNLDRMDREAQQQQIAKDIEARGLHDATSDDFEVTAQVTQLTCGVFYLAKHTRSEVLYSLRQESKAELIEANELLRVERERDVLSHLAFSKQQCSSLPTLLRAFHSPFSIYLLFKEKPCCDLATLIDVEPLPEPAVRFAGACVAQALHVLHDYNRIIYRNLSADNVHVLDNGYVCLMVRPRC